MVDGRSVDLVGVRELFGLTMELPGVGRFHGIHVVRVEPENRNACMSEQFRAAHLVLNFLTLRFRNNAHRRFSELIAAVADDGRERSNAVGIHNHFTDVTLRRERHVRSRRAARGACGGSGQRTADSSCNGAKEE